jgi:acetyl-CoA C-acetyltransferase
MVYDGLWDVHNDYHMGNTGEVVAQKNNITREEIDAFSVESHKRAAKAQEEGKFKWEMDPVEIKLKKKTITLDQDEGVRADSTLEALARLRPVFQKEGIVTAGNASQLSDGAAAVVVCTADKAKELGAAPIARIVDYTTTGMAPEDVMSAPIPGIKRIMERNNLSMADVDAFEHNEAFASASVAVMKNCEIPHEKLNIHGGAVALGHPIGASGARVLVTMMGILKDRGGKKGVCSLCLGGGNAVTMLIEML